MNSIVRNVPLICIYPNVLHNAINNFHSFHDYYCYYPRINAAEQIDSERLARGTSERMGEEEILTQQK